MVRATSSSPPKTRLHRLVLRPVHLYPHIRNHLHFDIRGRHLDFAAPSALRQEVRDALKSEFGCKDLGDVRHIRSRPGTEIGNINEYQSMIGSLIYSVIGTGPDRAHTVTVLCGWKHPRAPTVRLFFRDERTTPVVLTFLWDTNVERAGRARPENATFPLPLAYTPLATPPILSFFWQNWGEGEGDAH